MADVQEIACNALLWVASVFGEDKMAVEPPFHVSTRVRLTVPDRKLPTAKHCEGPTHETPFNELFWVGLVLVQVFSFRLHLLPALGNKGFASLILPAITLALPTGAVLGQVLAKSLRTQLAEPYTEIVYAKGASRTRVHFGHALRNAAMPALTLAGVVMGQLLAGAVVIETVFSRDGVGRVTAAAVNRQDIPVVQAVIVLAALFFVVINLVVDLLYPLLDPRVRHV